MRFHTLTGKRADSSWAIQARLDTTEGGARKLDATALEPVSFTVSRATIGSIRRISDSWSLDDEQQLKKAASRSKTSHFQLQLQSTTHLQDKGARKTHALINCTGIPLRWALGNKALTALPASRGSNCVMFNDKHAKGRLHRRDENSLQVFLLDSTAPVLKGLPIDGARMLCFALDRVNLVYEIRYEAGLRVLELRSSIVFASEANEAFRINAIRADTEHGWLSMDEAARNEKVVGVCVCRRHR
jgi:hypothetical protein